MPKKKNVPAAVDASSLVVSEPALSADAHPAPPEVAAVDVVWKGSADLKCHLVALTELDPDPKNVRVHPRTSIEAIKASFTAFGQRKLSVVWRKNSADRMIMIAGNGTLEALGELGWTHLGVSEFIGREVEARAFAIADNRTPEFSEWDKEGLALQMDWIDNEFKIESEVDFNPESIGFSFTEAAPKKPRENTKKADGKKSAEREKEATHEADDLDDSGDAVVTQVAVGDLYQMGVHRIICGDTTDPAVVARLMGDEKAACVVADPPYGLNKSGVKNDDLHGTELDAFQTRWWQAARKHVVDNGSAFVWGNPEDLWRWWFSYLVSSEKLEMKNEIVWSKGDGAGMSSDEMRSWAITTERAIFFMLGEQKLNINAENFWPGWEPLRAALAAECDRAGWTQKNLREITGSYMAKHWITRSQWSMITEVQYLKLQAAGAEKGVFQFPYSSVREVYETAKISYDAEIKKAFYEGRSFFDNAWDNMEEVWSFPRVIGDERHGHQTPKPVKMMERVLRSCCPSGGLVLEPFAGSGSTLIAAEECGRRCFTSEISPDYVATVIRRWEKLTGGKAVKL